MCCYAERMRVGVVIAVIVEVATARAEPKPIDCLAYGDYAADGVDFAPLERPLAMRVVAVDGELRLTASVTKLFDASAYNHLDRPATNLELQIVVASAGSDEPVAIHTIARSVHYDAWDERYTVQFDDRPPRAVRYRADALQLLTALDDVPIARLAELPRGAVTVAVVAELDPVSARSRAEIKSWLAGAGSVFGRMVSWFVDPTQDAADRVLRVRSTPFRAG